MALDSSSVALIGIGVAFAISVLTAIVFLILYARLKMKNDTNIRRRVIATTAVEAEKALIAREPEFVEEFIEPIPAPLPPPPLPPTVFYPAPVPIPTPAPPRPSPPPQQVFIVQPTPQPPPPPQPLPPPPPREPEVVVHEVIHRYEPAPPAPAPPQPPQERVVRRRSWGGPQEPDDDWVLVKITKSSGKKATKVRDDSSEESSDEEVEKKVKRRHKKRMDRYDLATSVVPFGYRPQPQMMASAAYMMAQPTTMMAQPNTMMAPSAVLAQPMMAANQPAYMPFFTVPR